MQYNIEKILEMIDEIDYMRYDELMEQWWEGHVSATIDTGKCPMNVGRKPQLNKLRAMLMSLNRYVEAVATVGAMALESSLEDEE